MTNKINMEGVVNWIKKDWIVICICLLTILGILIYGNAMKNYQDTCNQYWSDIIQDECECSFMQHDNFTTGFNLDFVFKNESNNRDTNT